MNTAITGEQRSCRSQIASWQKWGTFTAILLAAVVMWGLWGRSPALAVFMGALMLLGYAPVLAFELLLVVWTQKNGKVQRPRWNELVAAWWQELRQVPAVFAWRQPFRWHLFPDTVLTVNTLPTCSEGPAVVFVHGFVCNRGFWLPWMRELRRLDVPYVSVNLEPVLAGVDAFVSLLDAAVQRVEASTGQKPIFICHSMGGLVARAWRVSAPGNADRVKHIVTIGTPHHGTWLARWGHTASARQMRIGSAWLLALQKKEASLQPPPQAAQFTCWYSNTDNIVFPAAVATLEGADNRLVQGAAHVALAFQPIVMRESLEILASGDSSPMLRTAS